MKKKTRKTKDSREKTSIPVAGDELYKPEAGVPTENFFENLNLDDPGDLEEMVEDILFRFEEEYFLNWEAVLRQERGFPITGKQKKALRELLSFQDEDEERILYIDEIPRPDRPWYEIIRQVVPKLIIPRLKTNEGYYEVNETGWIDLAECIEEYGCELSLPEGVTKPIDIIPEELQHRLWIQTALFALCGLGQEAELTLVDTDQHFRIDDLIRSLLEHLESVKYFSFTLNSLLELVEMPGEDEKILREEMLKRLGMTSANDSLSDALLACARKSRKGK